MHVSMAYRRMRTHRSERRAARGLCAMVMAPVFWFLVKRVRVAAIVKVERVSMVPALPLPVIGARVERNARATFAAIRYA